VPRNASEYDQDFYAWTVQQAKLLRAGELSRLDTANLAEEIESLGRQDRRDIARRLEQLVIELLKWRVQAGARCGNWQSEILRQRFDIGQIIEDSPSLRQFATERLSQAYSDARERVIEELGLLRAEFPAECPFTLDRVMAEDFLPPG
jgi:hypothetical protein